MDRGDVHLSTKCRCRHQALFDEIDDVWPNHARLPADDCEPFDVLEMGVTGRQN